MIQVAKFSLQEKVRLEFQPITPKREQISDHTTCVMSDDEKMRVFSLYLYNINDL
jgi:hypothetical protein